MSLGILEYSDVGSTQRGVLNVPLEPPHAVQSLDIGLGSVQSAPLADSTVIVRLQSTIDAVIAVGTDPDATDSPRKLMAGVEQTIAVPPGKGMRIAVMASGGMTVSGMGSLESLLTLISKPAELEKQLAALSDGAAKHTAAAQANKDAVEALGHAGNLAEWEADLKQREVAVAAQSADLEARFAKFRALA